jgi:hypothetical protein
MMTATKSIQIRAPFMRKLERMLTQSMGQKYQHTVPLCTMVIQAKANSLFDKLNTIEPDVKVSLFAASAGWF